VPVLGLIFLRYADYRFGQIQAKLEGARTSRRRTVGPADYIAQGVVYLRPDAANGDMAIPFEQSGPSKTQVEAR
jgi:type I restriction enzyme M protein